MAEVLIVQNISREGTGLIANVLTEHKIEYKTLNLDNLVDLPDPSQYSAVFVLGGPDSANDETPKVIKEIRFIKEIINAGIPFFGICLGMQALVKAAGGEVIKHKTKEIGWKDNTGKNYTIELTSEGKKDTLFNGISSPFNIFQLHGETVELPEKVTLLGTGKHCVNQIVKVGENAYGFQGHLELTLEMLKRWSRDDQDLSLIEDGFLIKKFYEVEEEYTYVGERIIFNFLTIANLV